MLIGVDILASESMQLDLGQRVLRIGSCEDLTSDITIVSRSEPNLRRVVRAKSRITVPAHAFMEIPVQVKGSALTSDRDFLFEPTYTHDLGQNGGLYAHIVDASLSKLQLKNESDKPVVIQRHARLGNVAEYDCDGCFLVSPHEYPLANGKEFLAALIAASAPQPNDAREVTLPNGVRIHGNEETLEALTEVVNSFDIWTDRGDTVDIPEEQHMPITLLPQIKYQPAKIYPLSPKDKEVVDIAMDKLQRMGKVKFTTQPTPFSYPIFVVWKEVNGEKVGRMVVDIRGLNQITLPDTHPIPLQAAMIRCVAGCRYITIVDGSGYFHQWLVKKDDRYKITVVSHRGQEEF